MLRFHARNPREGHGLEHPEGPNELGRGPKRNDVPRCMIQDGYVSKDHVGAQELATGEVRIENLSQKGPIVLPDNRAIPPGGSANLVLPVRLSVGNTVIDAEM